jgi:hypothetical protein
MELPEPFFELPLLVTDKGDVLLFDKKIVQEVFVNAGKYQLQMYCGKELVGGAILLEFVKSGSLVLSKDGQFQDWDGVGRLELDTKRSSKLVLDENGLKSNIKSVIFYNRYFCLYVRQELQKTIDESKYKIDGLKFELTNGSLNVEQKSQINSNIKKLSELLPHYQACMISIDNLLEKLIDSQTNEQPIARHCEVNYKELFRNLLDKFTVDESIKDKLQDIGRKAEDSIAEIVTSLKNCRIVVTRQ